MGSKTISLAGLAFILGLVGAAPPVEAQESAFLAVVRDLATTPSGMSVTRDRMTAALAEWDRQINRLEAQVDAKADGPRREHAFKRHLELGLMYRRRGRLDDALRQFDAATACSPMPRMSSCSVR